MQRAFSANRVVHCNVGQINAGKIRAAELFKNFSLSTRVHLRIIGVKRNRLLKSSADLIKLSRLVISESNGVNIRRCL